MKTFKAFTLLLATLLATNICAQTVTLDPTFGENGMTVIPATGTGQFELFDFDKRGNIIAVGHISNEDKCSLVIVKTNANGMLDQSFGTNGIVTIPEYNKAGVLALKITKENKIFITGNFENKRCFMQFNGDGALDETFGDNGKIILELGMGTLTINLENDDFVLFGSIDPNSDQPCILKCNYYGVIDETFGENGRLYLTISEELWLRPRSIKMLNDQSILIAGTWATFCKIDTHGNFVTDFANNGIRIYALESNGYPATTIAPYIIDIKEDLNGNLTLLVTVHEVLPTLQVSIACRFYPNGDTDSSFGVRGYYRYSWPYPYSYYYPERPQKILQNGDNYIIGAYDKIRNLNHSGILDPDFNHTGIYDCENFVFQDMKLQGTDKLILGGTSNGNLAIIRLSIPYKATEITHYTENRINIFPNPTTNYLYFNKEVKFEIMDIQGRVLLRSKKPVQSVNVSHLRAGVYFIKFEGGNVGKFLKI
ncbi:MAG: T9SS type A sorting domain-containing protein [Lentimicrobiaceae bacterium]|nr:T9SS type A sorting domain-containing protein [Lentimicrobiaceae bacterium]